MTDDGDLDALLTVRAHASEPGTWLLAVPDGWQQGRGAFGGVALGAMVRAVVASEPDAGRRPRSISAELMAPLLVSATAGEAQIAVELLRAGSGLSFRRATLRQDGVVVAHMVVSLGSDRPEAPRVVDPAVPAVGSWEDVPAVMLPAPPAPLFTRHLEYRVTGPLPFAGAASNVRAEGWVRARVRPRVLDTAHVVALSDAYWFSLLSTFTTPRPAATVAVAMHLALDPGLLDPEAPLLHRARCPVAGDGFAADTRELWSARGELVAVGQQTVVVIK